ncbi:unnamed protein product [Adineta ricciae]|uniref:Uncharacterized protein n=1 Tax=Adineta ricciae TaxID=249248 RepID=A0A816EJY4_ADIRI|nr:unnamed protein product [Adineta ricciae]
MSKLTKTLADFARNLDNPKPRYGTVSKLAVFWFVPYKTHKTNTNLTKVLIVQHKSWVSFMNLSSSSSCPLGLTPVGANHFMGSDFSIPVDLGPGETAPAH